MEALLNVPGVSSHQDTRGLRKLHDTVEAHVRGLEALKVPSQTYGGFLASTLINKIPPELRLIITREMTGLTWDLARLMKIFGREIEAREHAFVPTNDSSNTRRNQPRLPTAAALVATSSESNRKHPICVYCNHEHTSNSCSTVTDAVKRKESLRKTGRCFVCLRRHHLSKDCRSTFNCKRCRGRHHVSICTRSAGKPHNSDTGEAPSESTGTREVPPTTNSLYAGCPSHILLQTARLELVNSSGPPVRALFDSGSQRTYVTSQLRDKLKLATVGTERIRIKTFGNTESCDKLCDVVHLTVKLEEGETLSITALVVPMICSPLTSQPINASGETYEHLAGLKLADSGDPRDTMEVDVLIGSDWYWSLVTGRVIRGESGPTAIHTKVGWILSGPTSNQATVNLTFSTVHTLKVDTVATEPSLDDQLKKFWELESLGIPQEESPIYEKFLQQIRFDGQRYEVSLPWKEPHLPLPDHYDLCCKRLGGLLMRLRRDPQLLKEYNQIICDQLEKGMIEKVPQPDTVSDRIHYLPHHGVVRRDKATSKLRVVYDASARSTGPSLNDCLYTGPKSGQSIFDILLRFRHQRVALTGDVEKAFLMVSVRKEDRDSLRFLWTADPNAEQLEPTPFRFTRVVFGVSSSPFLLNATVNHHLETFREVDPEFVDKFLSSIYVDDLVSGGDDVLSTHEFYVKSRLRLATAGFKLRKFTTNSAELRSLIEKDEAPPVEQNDNPHCEEDQTYAKTSLGVKGGDGPGTTKVLGVLWNVPLDQLQFSVADLMPTMESLEPTKRNLVSVAAKLFDPLGVVSPVIVLFKMFCQQLCGAKVGWDDPLQDEFLRIWQQLLTMLKGAEAITIPRCIYSTISPKTARLVGFCDALAKAYAAVVYIRLEDGDQVDVKFLAAKTRVTPTIGVTIPRLELLSALLLSKLLVSVQTALGSILDEPICFTDSKASLYWIQGVRHEWKQFVENRVVAIGRLIPSNHWRHCPGTENPADIPSRGMGASELSNSSLWLNGPDWLWHGPKEEKKPVGDTSPLSVPEECQKEMKLKDIPSSTVAVNATEPSVGMSQVIRPDKYSSSHRLFRVTALVLRFVKRIRGATDTPSTVQPEVEEIAQAKLKWMKDMQRNLPNHKDFTSRRQKLGLFVDENGLWRCGGRMSNSSLPASAENPILLDQNHHLTTLLILDAHKRVLHNGTRETLAELRSVYWVIRGRQIVKGLIRSCVTCRRHEGSPCQGVPPPPLPAFRVSKSRPFQTTGVDFAGPLYVRSSNSSSTTKVWMVLYTCYVTRAVHLDLVPDMTTETFLRSFRRFVARRGIPARMLSDNARTFKSAAVSITNVLESPEVKNFFGNIPMDWQFNLEKAPWQGGAFERMIKSAKRCLRKAIGKNCLNFDELLTLVIEVEGVLNSRPLTYVYDGDVTEALTPSHLLTGHRILTLPDASLPDEADEDYTPENLTRRAAHLVKTLEKFWKRWKREYLLELREFHRTGKQRGVAHVLQSGEVVSVYDEGHPLFIFRFPLGGRTFLQSFVGKLQA